VGEGDDAGGLGVLQGERAGERRRRHGAGEREGRDDDGLAGARHVISPSSIGPSTRSGELVLTTVQRPGLSEQLGARDSAGDAIHGEAILHPPPPIADATRRDR